MKVFWQNRKINLKAHLTDLTLNSFTEQFQLFLDIIFHNYHAYFGTNKFSVFFEMWQKEEVWKDCMSVRLALEILLVETPSNVFAETMGRIVNMIYNN